MDEDGSTAAVAIGGTFDPIHDGHRALFHRAFLLGHVTVGLTTDRLAAEIRDGTAANSAFGVRLRELDTELREWASRYDRCYEIRPLDRPTGIAHASAFDALVVSPETEPAGNRINDIRRERDIEPLDIERVAHVKAADGQVISSTRIREGAIDEHGNLTGTD